MHFCIRDHVGTIRFIMLHTLNKLLESFCIFKAVYKALTQNTLTYTINVRHYKVTIFIKLLIKA